MYESVSHEIYTYCDQHENKGLDRKLDKEVLKNNSKLCLQIFIWKRNFEVVPIFSSEDVKASLVCFVGDTISHFGAEHHLIAAHKVVHHILQRRLKSLFVDQIEEYFEIGGVLRFWERGNRARLA